MGVLGWLQAFWRRDAIPPAPADTLGAATLPKKPDPLPLAVHERAALISFTYNVGSAALASSTLRKLLNAGDRAGAALRACALKCMRGEFHEAGLQVGV